MMIGLELVAEGERSGDKIKTMDDVFIMKKGKQKLGRMEHNMRHSNTIFITDTMCMKILGRKVHNMKV